MNFLRPLFLVLLSSVNVCQAESLMFMRAASIYCPQQFADALIEIIDAKSERELRRAIGTAIASGACVGSSSTPLATVGLFKKNTPAGNVFLCFNLVDADGNPMDQRHCSPISSLMSVAEEKKRRAGDYEILREGVGATKAACKEGGFVTIHKGDQWTRSSEVLPSKTSSGEKVISRDQDREIREGCKGADSDD